MTLTSRIKSLLLLCISKSLRRDNRFKVSALLYTVLKGSEVVSLVGLTQPSTRSRSALTMAKVSADVQAVVKRLLSLEWHPANCDDPKYVFCKKPLLPQVGHISNVNNKLSLRLWVEWSKSKRKKRSKNAEITDLILQYCEYESSNLQKYSNQFILTNLSCLISDKKRQ